MCFIDPYDSPACEKLQPTPTDFPHTNKHTHTHTHTDLVHHTHTSLTTHIHLLQHTYTHMYHTTTGTAVAQGVGEGCLATGRLLVGSPAPTS